MIQITNSEKQNYRTWRGKPNREVQKPSRFLKPRVRDLVSGFPDSLAIFIPQKSYTHLPYHLRVLNIVHLKKICL